MRSNWLLPVFVRSFLRSALSNLPLSDYHKTMLWAALRLSGRKGDWPYYRCVELAMRDVMAQQSPQTGFSMLEFGVAAGDTFTKLLHFRDVWARRLGVKNRVIGIGFDTFEGLPDPRAEDVAVHWRRGDYRGDEESIRQFLAGKFKDFQLIKGLFSDTLEQQIGLLKEFPPIFVAIDCDFYSSTIDVLERLLPDIAPHGCLFYFDDVGINFYSDKSGELRAIAEVNAGRFGNHIQLVEYPLWLETRLLDHYRRVYRLVNMHTADRIAQEERTSRGPYQLLRRDRISPL